MFLVFSGVYSLCIASASSPVEMPQGASIEEVSPSMTVKVAPDGKRHLKIAPSTHFIATPSSLGVWEISGDTAVCKVAGVLKVESSTRGIFSGTVFETGGQVLTTQIIEVLQGGSLKATDLISEESYVFTKAQLLKGPDSSMTPEQISALASSLSFVSATAQP